MDELVVGLLDEALDGTEDLWDVDELVVELLDKVLDDADAIENRPLLV